MSESQILPHPDGCRVVAFSRHGGTPDTIEIETPRGTLTKSMGKDFMNLSAERVKVGGTHRRVYQLYAEALLRTGRVGAVAVAPRASIRCCAVSAICTAFANP